MKFSCWLPGWKPAFVPPAGLSSRVAIVHTSLRTRTPGSVFDPSTPDLAAALKSFRPESLAAPYPLLAKMARTLRLDRFVVVFSEAGGARLQFEQRERLWDLYQVPVFEQLLSTTGELLAAECEAHDGLHVVAPALSLPVVDLIEGPCPCGMRTQRLPAVFDLTRACAASDAGVLVA